MKERRGKGRARERERNGGGVEGGEGDGDREISKGDKSMYDTEALGRNHTLCIYVYAYHFF